MPILFWGSVSIGACGQEGGSNSSDGAGPRESVTSAQNAQASPALPDPSIWETPQKNPKLEAGRLVWSGTCIQCHSNGLGGAPLIGNADLWMPRVDKGLETLVNHALGGFYGDVGEMPARGGNDELSDEEVRAAVLFMASRVSMKILEDGFSEGSESP